MKRLIASTDLDDDEDNDHFVDFGLLELNEK